MQKNIYSLSILVLITISTISAQLHSLQEHSPQNLYNLIELSSADKPYLARFTAESHPIISYFLEFILKKNSASITQDQKELYASCQKNEFMSLTNILTVLQDIKTNLESLQTRADRVSDNSNPPVGNNQFLNNIIRVIRVLDQDIDDCCDEILAAIASLTSLIMTDFQNTWTILADINTTLTTCCDDILIAIDDLNNTVTTDFQNTWTILAALSDSGTTCCNGTFTALAALNTTVTTDFANTWTILADIKTTMTNDFLATWTILEACSMTPIFTPTTITVPGTYCLSNNITGSIVIAASNVTLDLNYNSISQTTNGIVVNSLQTNVLIKNGTIASTTLEGILVQQGAQEVTLRNIELISCGTTATPFAVHLQGVSASHVINCVIDNVNVYSSPSGILLENADACLVQNCIVSSCGNIPLVSGFGVLGTSITATASSNGFVNCTVKDCTSTSTIAGFSFQNAADTICRSCVIDNLQALNITGGIRIINSYNTAISDATITSVSITSTASQNLLVTLINSAYYCAGIEINSSATNTIKNIVMSDIGSTTTVVQDNFGIFFNNVTSGTFATTTPDLMGENISINTINLSFAHSTGIGQAIPMNVGWIFLNNCTINNLLGQNTAYGVSVQIAGGAVIKNSSVMNTTALGSGTGDTRGFYITPSPSLTAATLIDRCQANSFIGGVTAIGFDIETPNAIINDSLAIKMTAISSGIVNQLGAGFFVSGTETIVNNCIVDFVTSVSASTGHGFLSTNGASITYCQASNCSNGSGIRITGIGSLVTNSIASNSAIGIQNVVGVATKIVNCISFDNTTNYNGNLPTPALAAGASPTMGANLALT